MPKVIEPIMLELRDGPRPMVFDMAAAISAQRALNKLRGYDPPKSIFAIIDAEMKSIEEFSIDLDFLTVLIWASLLDGEPDLTIEKTQKQIINLGEAIKQVVTMLRTNFLGAQGDNIAEDINATEKKKKKPKANGHLDARHSQEFT